MKIATTLALSSLTVLALAAFTTRERGNESRPMKATGMFTATRQ